MKTISIAIIILTALPSRAAEFYVSSIHANRSDTHSGNSPDAPWATFDKIKSEWGSRIRPGDTVHLERGSRWTWSGGGYWKITTGGSASGGRMTIRGDDYGTGDPPILQKTGSTAWDDTFAITGSAGYITLRDFTVDNGSQQGYAASGVLIGGSSQNGLIREVDVLNMTFRNLGNKSSVYVGGIRVGAYNNNTVEDCLIEGNDVSTYTGHGLNHYSQKPGYLSQNRLNRIIWRNNRVHSPSPNNYGGVGSGLHISFGGSDNLFEYNYIEGSNPASSIFLMNSDGDESGMIIRHNVVASNPHMYGNGIIVVRDSSGVAGTHAEGSIYGNIIANCGAAGISIESENHFSADLKIYNNTLINNGNVYSGEIYIKDANSNVDLDIRNNLVIHSASTLSGITIRPGYSGKLTHSHNIYWHTSGSQSRTAIDDMRNGRSYTIATVTEFDPTSRGIAPRLTNLNGIPTALHSDTGTNQDGLLPLPDSPAVDQGVALDAAYSSSIDTTLRPTGEGWEIGAYETAGPIAQPLTAPSDLTATPQSPSTISLSWADNTDDETAFLLERRVAGDAFGELAALPADTTTYTDSDLQDDTAYSYRLRALRDAVSSDYSNLAEATTPALPDTIAPRLTWAKAVDPARIMLTFSEPLDATTATNTANYSLPSPFRPGRVSYGNGVVTILVSPSPPAPLELQLQLTGLRDAAGNTLAGGTQTNILFAASDPSLVGWFPFENNASDQSETGASGTVSGPSPTPQGRIGNAYMFSATTDYIQIPFSLMSPAAGTVSLWANLSAPPDGTTPRYLFGLSNPDAWSDTIQLYSDDTGAYLDLGMAGAHPLAGALAVLTPQQWHHVALTWQDGTYAVYKEGELLATGQHAPFNAFNSFADIGNCGRATARDEGMIGIIDEVRLYNRALLPAEIRALANPLTIPTPPPNVTSAP